MSAGKGSDWSAVYRQLLKRIDKAALDADVVEYLERHPRARWTVACSGGADSVCLLLLLVGHFPERRDNLRVLHVNHGLRGEAAEADAAFVSGLAERLRLPFILETAPKDSPRGNEAELRAIRAAAYAKHVDDDPPGLLLTGHQAEDVVETLLMRLARGSGAAGLSAPRPIQHFPKRVHLRPLLTLRRADLREALEASGGSWREDASNAEPTFLRNRVRAEILPALEATFGEERDWCAGFLAARERLAADEAAFQELARRQMPDCFEGRREVALEAFANVPEALARRALEAWLQTLDLHGSLGAAAFQQILTAAREQRRASVSAGVGRAVVSDPRGGVLAFERNGQREGGDAPFSESDYKTTTAPIHLGSTPRWPVVMLPRGIPIRLSLPGGRALAFRLIELDDALRQSILEGQTPPDERVYLTPLTFTRRIEVRLWREGDRYRPLGSPGERKLQDCFVDRKIPRNERAIRPILCAQGEPIWCPGLLPAASARIEAESIDALEITYLRT